MKAPRLINSTGVALLVLFSQNMLLPQNRPPDAFGRNVAGSHTGMLIDRLHRRPMQAGRHGLPAGPRRASRHSIPLRPGLQQSDSVSEAWVRQYASGRAPGSDFASDIVVDPSGDIYVTGRSSRQPYGSDILTMKLDTLGRTIWEARYPGKGYGDASTGLITLDNAGHVYVAAAVDGLGTSWDYILIKYNAAGTALWTARYDGPANSADWPQGVSVDSSGNAYVTGYSEGAGSGADFATIKYSAEGAELWVARYDGPDHLDDYPAGVAVDDSGNVYVAGESDTPDSSGNYQSSDYATIKYGPDGERLWAARYHGPLDSYDRATAIALNRSGGVIVTGVSYNPGTSGDYTTIQYSRLGEEEWIATYNGTDNFTDVPWAMAVDASGGVVVTGACNFPDNPEPASREACVTVKYDSSGVRQWAAVYDGPGNGQDIGIRIGLGDSGSVYVAGISTGTETQDDFATIKFDSNGVQEWVARYNGPGNDADFAVGLAVGPVGHIVVCGGSIGTDGEWDFTVAGYDDAGNTGWVLRYDGPGTSNDYARAMALDRTGNIYITGSSYNAEGFPDYVTVKYDETGAEVWSARLVSPAGSRRYPWGGPSAIAVDDSGNVVVTGSIRGSTSLLDFATVKYDANGVQKWLALYNGPADSTDGAVGLVVDRAGNVYVTGTSMGLGIQSDYATIKYSPSGVEEWVQRYDGSGTFGDNACGIAMDGSGNVAVTGYGDGKGAHFDYITVSYNPSGRERWVERYNGPGNFYDRAYGIAADPRGNFMVTGQSAGPGGNSDGATVSYDSAGRRRWVARYDSPDNAFDELTAISVDAFGETYVTGYSDEFPSPSDMVTIKYDTGGVRQWIALYRSGSPSNYPRAIAVDRDLNVIVTGWTSASGSPSTALTIRYNPAGIQEWVAGYRGPGAYGADPEACAVDSSGKVVIAGSNSGNGWSVFTTIKYITLPLGVRTSQAGAPQTYSLLQNYPNPFNPATIIEYTLSAPAQVRLALYDVLGREVLRLAEGKQQAGSYRTTVDASHLPGGVYFYRLQAGAFSQTRKLLLVR